MAFKPIFFSPYYPTIQFLLLVTVFYIYWHMFFKQTPDLEELTVMRLNRVNFLFAASMTQLLIIILLISCFEVIPEIIAYSFVVSWLILSVQIVTIIKIPRLLKLVSLFVLISAPFFALHFKLNLLALAPQIDGAVVCFDVADEERYRGAWADANLPRGSGDNGEMFPKRTPSILVALYYFTSFFVLLYYYGWAYRVQHEQLRASGLGSALDVASLDPTFPR